jgi:hypothetical protein
MIGTRRISIYQFIDVSLLLNTGNKDMKIAKHTFRSTFLHASPSYLANISCACEASSSRSSACFCMLSAMLLILVNLSWYYRQDIPFAMIHEPGSRNRSYTFCHFVFDEKSSALYLATRYSSEASASVTDPMGINENVGSPKTRLSQAT